MPSRGGPLAGAHLKAEPPDLAPLLSLLSQASLFRSAPPLRQRIPLLGHTPAASPAHFIAARSPLFPCGLQSGYQYFPCLEPRLKRSLRSGQGGKERFGRGSALSGDAEPAGGGEGVRKAGLLRSLRSVKGTAPADTSFSSTQPPISLPPYSPFAAKPTATTHALFRLPSPGGKGKEKGVAKPQEILFKVWQSHRNLIQGVTGVTGNQTQLVREFFFFSVVFANQEIRLKEGKILAIS